jgi:ribosome-associated protein
VKKTAKKAVKKATAKKPATKAVAKKPIKKIAAKKAVKKAAPKKLAKKAVKKAAPKKAVKKAVKAAPKKAIKKAAPKKAIKKAVKAAPKKAIKKAAPKKAVKKVTAKKATVKKAVSKKVIAKKVVAKKTVAKKPAAKKAVPKKPAIFKVAAPVGPRYAGPDWPLMNVILDSMEDSKAEQIIAINLEGRSSMADGMVIASGRANRHVAAIADQLVTKLKATGQKDIRVEGLDQSDWVLVDAGNVIVHIFRPEVRSFYNLEKLWSEHSPVEQGTMESRDAE